MEININIEENEEKKPQRSQRTRRERGEEKIIFSSSVRSVVVFSLLFPILAGLCFTACPTEAENEGGDVIEVSLPIDGSGDRHYYDLSSGGDGSLGRRCYRVKIIGIGKPHPAQAV
jgi:hypothetical protein